MLEEPPRQDAPDMVQLENCQLVEGVPVIDIEEPTSSEQPLGQLGETEPEPEATFVVKVWVIGVKVAKTVTAWLGIEKAHGLVEGPSEQVAPLMFQPENCQLTEGVAEIEIGVPTTSAHPLEQFGDTEPDPEATFVVKV